MFLPPLSSLEVCDVAAVQAAPIPSAHDDRVRYFAQMLESERKKQVPEMPTVPANFVHRTKYPECPTRLADLAVARPVSKKEIKENPSLPSGDCKQAQAKEWKRLIDKKVWDMSAPVNWRKKAKECRDTGKRIHMGRILSLIHI